VAEELIEAACFGEGRRAIDAVERTNAAVKPVSAIAISFPKKWPESRVDLKPVSA